MYENIHSFCSPQLCFCVSTSSFFWGSKPESGLRIFTITYLTFAFGCEGGVGSGDGKLMRKWCGKQDVSVNMLTPV